MQTMANDTEDKQELIDESNETHVDESLGFTFMSSIKITELDTGKVLVQKRCD